MTTSPLSFAVETCQLTKKFGNTEVVRRLDLKVPQGTITGFLGQNGAGKSTTLKMLMGAVRPSSGSGRIFGLAIDDPAQSVEIRRRVAFVSEDKRLYDYMTVEQVLRFTRSFFPNWRSDLEQKFLREFPLPFDRKIKKLSKGMRTQLALLLGIARGPEMLVLDEPTEGLDPVAIETVLQLLKTLAVEGMTVFFSSHQIAEVEQIANHVFFLHRGELLLSSSMEQLKRDYRRVRIDFAGPVPEHQFALKGVMAIEPQGNTVFILLNHNLEQVLERARELQASNVEVLPVGLKEVFLQSLKTR